MFSGGSQNRAVLRTAPKPGRSKWTTPLLRFPGVLILHWQAIVGISISVAQGMRQVPVAVVVVEE